MLFWILSGAAFALGSMALIWKLSKLNKEINEYKKKVENIQKYYTGNVDEDAPTNGRPTTTTGKRKRIDL